jgi:hypothetical protein
MKQLEKRKYQFSCDLTAMSFWSAAARTAFGKSENGGVYFSGSQNGCVVEVECFKSVMPLLINLAETANGKVVPRRPRKRA